MRGRAALLPIIAAFSMTTGPCGSGESSPSPSASLSPPPEIHVTAVGTLPADPRFFQALNSEQNAPRILLFDSSATKPPVEVVRLDPTSFPVPLGSRAFAFGASADGRVLVMARRISEQSVAHYLVRPETGELAVLREDASPSVYVPVVSPDGARYAYPRLGDAATNGVWIADAQAGSPPRRIVVTNPGVIGSPPDPIAWSPDGAWLAVAWDVPGHIGLLRVDAGETTLDLSRREFSGGNARVLGPGRFIDWAGGDQVLVTSSRLATSGRSVVYASSVTGGEPRELYVPTGATELFAARWHPGLDRFYVEEFGRSGGGPSVWIRKPDGTGVKVFEAPSVGVPWWSRDGTRLWSLTGGNATVGMVRDLLSTTAITFCVRSASPPCP